MKPYNPSGQALAEFNHFERKKQLGQKLGNYYRTYTGPLGSTDRKCAVDTKSLFTDLNGGNSELASLWAEKSIASWVQSLSTTGPHYIPDVEGLGTFYFLVLHGAICYFSWKLARM